MSAEVREESLDEKDLLITWLDKNNLARHSKAMMDPDGCIGLARLQDLLDLSEEDVDEVVKELALNIGERKRLTRGISELRSEREAAELDTEANAEAADGAGASAGAPSRKGGFSSRSNAGTVKQDMGPRPDEFFEVVKSMVFVRSAPKKNATGVGILRLGTHIQVCGHHKKDDEGNEWVQLTDAEFWRSCEPEAGTAVKTGYALVDGKSMGLGRLLRGPLTESEVLPTSTPSPEDVIQGMQQFQQGKPRMSQEELVLKQMEDSKREEERKVEQQRQDRQAATADALERAKANADAAATAKGNQLAHRDGQAPPPGAVALRSTGRHIFVKQSQDPAAQKVARFDCRPGATFYVKDGSKWQGPQGGLWMEHALRPFWLLVEDAGHGGVLLLKETDAEDYATVSVDYLSSRGDIRILETFINVQSSVKSLNARICSETGLKAKGTFLFSKRPPLQGMPRRQDVMQANESLLSFDILAGSEARLYLLYPFDFELDYHGGAHFRKGDGY